MGHPHISKQVYDHLKAHPQVQFTAQQIAKATGASAGGVRTTVRNMIKEGKPLREIEISAHKHVYLYTRSAPAAHKPVAEASVSEVTLMIPSAGGPVQVSLSAARKLYNDLRVLFGGEDAEKKGDAAAT